MEWIMNLKEVIDQINVRVVRSILAENGFSIRENAQEEAEEQMLLRNLLDEEMAAMQAKKLTDSEKIVLAFFIFGVGHDMVTYRQLEMWSRTAPYSVIGGLTGLRRKGLVYTLRRLWGELAYVMPYDLQKIWRAYLLAQDDGGTNAEGLEEASPSTPLCDVIFALLQAHRTQPVALTKRGLPSARLRREWIDKLPYEKEAFHMFYPAGQEDGTAIFVFFLELLKEMELLIPDKKRQEELFVNDEACTELFTGHAGTVQAKLYPAVSRMIEKQHPLYPILFEWLECHSGQWVSMEAVSKQWADRIPQIGRVPDATAEKKETIVAAVQKFVDEAAPLLSAFGLVSIADTSNGIQLKYTDTHFSGSSLLEGENEYVGNTGYVQPTFEVLLLPHAPYHVRWQIGAFSQLIGRQEVWIFHVTKRSVESFMQTDGAAVDDILRTLAAVQGGDVPDNVSGQIRDWTRVTRTAAWEPVVWLNCPDLETAEQIEKDPALSASIKRRISGQEFLVDSSAVPIFTEMMEKWGVPLRQAVSAGGQPEKSVERTLTRKEQAGSEYKVESVFPNLTDALPELKSIPAIWYKNWQKYHGSTLRSLVEAALTIAIPVSLEYEGKKLNVTVEEHIQHNGQSAIIVKEEYGRQTIVLAQIGRIQLLLPRDLPFE
jgi:hypothetical protein